MGLFDIIHFTEASLESSSDDPSVWACFGFYPRDMTYTMLVYEAVMYGEHLTEPQKAVVKIRRFRAGTEHFWQPRLDANTHASSVACVFTEKTGAGKITFVDQYLAPLKGYSRWEKFCRSTKHYEFRDLKKNEIVLIEPMVSDNFDLEIFESDIILDAFSHFSYVEGNRQSVIAVFKGIKQGNEYYLITPKIHTSQKDISDFFSEHTCNDLCHGWYRPHVVKNEDVPLFHLPSEHLKLQKQSSVRVQEVGEHAQQTVTPIQYSKSFRSPSFDRQESQTTPEKKRVTTIMHAVYVHEDPSNQTVAPSAPFLDNSINKERAESPGILKRNNTERVSPRIKNQPVRVQTLETQNVRVPKQSNIHQQNKPEIKPKPIFKEHLEIKPKPQIKAKPVMGDTPDIKPKPEIKPKPKLKRQERTETEENAGINEKLSAQKMAVQDELKARLSKISLNKTPEATDKSNTANINDSSMFLEKGPEKIILVPHVDKQETNQESNVPGTKETVDVNVDGASCKGSPKFSDGITEKKVKSKKSLRKQATLVT